MHVDTTACLRAVRARDTRFDGVFFAAVRTTGIYCRPSCPAIVANGLHLRFYPSAAAAQSAGFRACRRCLPDASPGSPEWDRRGDTVARAMRLIGDGLVDREGVSGLAARLGYSTRQLERQVLAELGAGPLAVARALRAQTARLLIETSAMAFGEVAFAAGFSSIRTFNDTVRAVFARTPTELRRAARHDRRSAPGVLVLRLAYRPPFAEAALWDTLGRDAVSGVEDVVELTYRRTMRLPRAAATVNLRPGPGHVACELVLDDVRDLPVAISRCRRLLDLDADPEAVDRALIEDPALARTIRGTPGLRVARTVDSAEFAMRALFAQGDRPDTARMRLDRLVSTHGTPLADPVGGLTHLFPEPGALADLGPVALGLPRPRAAAFAALVGALATGALDLGPGSDWRAARGRLAAIPGIAPATIEQIAARALGDPDAFSCDDEDLRCGADALGFDRRLGALATYSTRWRPWRAYAAQYLRAARTLGRAPTTRRPRAQLSRQPPRTRPQLDERQR